MLHSSYKKCSHSKVLPPECCSFCVVSAPEPLLDICFEYILNNIKIICDEQWNLRDNITLPVEICEKLLHTRASKTTPKISSDFTRIFENIQATKLKRVRLRNTDIDDKGLCTLLKHHLYDLDISQSPLISKDSLQLFTELGRNLVSITLSDNNNLFPFHNYGKMVNDEKCIFEAGNLKKLAVRNVCTFSTYFYSTLLQPFQNLTHLDLSNCSYLGDLEYIEQLKNLTSLILYNVNKIEAAFPSICKLTNLRHLDVSHSNEDIGKYQKPSLLLAQIVESLPKLTSLDISGTNLAGTGVAEMPDISGRFASDIPGLGLRVKTPFQFLGLYETQHDACLRHDIPAKLISGNANEEQILVAALAYLDRAEMLQKVLNELFHLFKFESCEHIGQALYIILESMNRHVNERHIQVSGSATLFYIVKGTGKELHEVVQVKRRIITTLLNGMCAHRFDDTMMRNGCLTLCQFKIPSDVVFDFDRLVEILLHSVYGMHQENFVQRIGIYLLNSLACQVDGYHKIKLGELGAIKKMLWLISDRYGRGLCDDVLEVAWSTMWNVTDESPENCRKFLRLRGMDYFLKCLHKFPEKDELLRNMMGLLGNVAEVHALRHYLMNSEYISVFSDLLDSVSDGIEVSYNAAGVLSHIASDGPEVWRINNPTREEVLNRMMQAIDRWDISSQRNINYRSFEPILYLVKVYGTPECQRWAVWALANLTKVYPTKYCDLLISEGGIVLLKEVIENPIPPICVKELAAIVIENCKNFKERCCLLEG